MTFDKGFTFHLRQQLQQVLEFLLHNRGIFLGTRVAELHQNAFRLGFVDGLQAQFELLAEFLLKMAMNK